MPPTADSLTATADPAAGRAAAPEHGIRACLDSRGLRIDGPVAGAPTLLTLVTLPDGQLLGGVYGPVSLPEARALVAGVSSGADPAGPDVPWLAVARAGREGLAAAASTMLPSGAFWSSTGGSLVVASDPASASGDAPRIAAGYIRSYAAGEIDPAAAPFEGVARLPAGQTAVWEGATCAPRVHEWCGPGTWAAPGLAGPEALRRFREAHDLVVADLAARAGAVVATVSGGLDSTFVAATLASQAGPNRVVRGLTYSPLGGARLELAPGMDADELSFARLLEAAYPGRIEIEPVVNVAGVRPLAAAALAARLAGVPTFNPANQVWLNAMGDLAAQSGARLLFVGTNGNSAFSYDHGYAVRDSLRRRAWADLARMSRTADGRLDLGLLRTRVMRPLGRAQMSRPEYLQWLARRLTGLPAAANPMALGGVLLADPFTSRAVLECAAAIAPAEWRMGGMNRAFARRAGAGRVPDPIRLRTRRGQQGRDAWHVIRNDRDDYLARIDAVPGVAGLEAVDAAALMATVEAWPWGQEPPAPWREQVAADRILGLAEFASFGRWPGRRVP